MRFDKLTIRAQEALAEAMDSAANQNHGQITSLHLLAALVAQDQGARSSVTLRVPCLTR